MAPPTKEEEQHEGASASELLIEACRRDNPTLLLETLASLESDDARADALNKTTTVMGNHLYHEAALRGNYDVIDTLLDQDGFECDPVNRIEGDTPLHSAIRWINSEPVEQREFGNALVEMMLEAGSSPRVKNKGGLTPLQLVDPSNEALRDIISKHEYASLNAGDFVSADEVKGGGVAAAAATTQQQQQQQQSLDQDDDFDEDAEFSGSDDEERARVGEKEGGREGKLKKDKRVSLVVAERLLGVNI